MFDVTSWMQPRDYYRFIISNRPEGDPDVETRGPSVWNTSEDLRYNLGNISLTFNGSGDSGIMMFRSRADHALSVECGVKADNYLSVILGVHNYNVWCDIAPCLHGDIEALAKEYLDGSKRDRRWENLDRRTVTTPDGLGASLAIRPGRDLTRSVFFVDITANEDFELIRLGPGQPA